MQHARLPTDVYTNICRLGINRKPPTRRGKRAGKKSTTILVSGNYANNTPVDQPPHRLRPTASAILWNAQSIRNKTDLLCEMILEHDTDITILTETWLKADDQVVMGDMCPPGYSVLSAPRQSGRGGGIGIVFKSQLNLQLRNSVLPPSSTFEHALVTYRHSNINFAIVYRPPSSSVTDFLAEFEDFVCALEHLPGRCVVLGDFNLHYDCPSKPEIKAFTTIIASLNYRQLIHDPTHTAGHTLDFVIVKDDYTLVDSYSIYHPHSSDHLVIKFNLDLDKPRDMKTTYIYHITSDLLTLKPSVMILLPGWTLYHCLPMMTCCIIVCP